MLSESLVSAIVEVLAILCRADGVDERERQVVRAYLNTLLNLEKAEYYIGEFEDQIEDGFGELTDGFVGLKISGQVIRICDKLNQGLTANEKVRLIIVMFTLVNADGTITELERDLVYAAAEVFNINFQELGLIERFVFLERPDQANHRSFQLFLDRPHPKTDKGHDPIVWPGLRGMFVVLWLEGVNLWVVKYIGSEGYQIDGVPMVPNQPLELTKGSSIRGGAMDTLYFAEILRIVRPQDQERKVTFVAEKISYNYPNGQGGLHTLDINERSGRLVGIMGPSGSGKSTLLEILIGLRQPATGQVRLNGYDIHKRGRSIEGLIGYVPQDDMLIEDLTVAQNLYYAARLSFAKLSEAELNDLVIRTLAEVELLPIKDQLVGGVHDRYISGGERKRVNMALELLRKPAVFFLDEPTSGLSSRDSLSIIDLLKEQTFVGKLIFVVIHQPSSDIFKLFDHLIILDKGGYPIYYGDPVAAVVYFKQCIHQVSAEVSVCPVCANINPEQVFDIIEGRTLNHVGHFTSERRIAPGTWYSYYRDRLKKPAVVQEVRTRVRMPQRKPNAYKQWLAFTARDLTAKWANKQYVWLNALTAPILAIVLGFINYHRDSNAEVIGGDAAYSFANNDNIPAYLFMSTVVAIFLGLTLSATEILDDRKLLRRERFLHLSRMSYLMSKVGIMFGILALQMAAFTLIGNQMLELKGHNFTFWLTLFSLSACSTLTSLILSSTFRSAVTIYVLIPILLIPQLLLGGVVIPYAQINQAMTDGNRVPTVAEWIPARWGFEGLMVHQFVNNPYMAPRYNQQREIALTDIKQNLLFPQLRLMHQALVQFKPIANPDSVVLMTQYMNALRYHLKAEAWDSPVIRYPEYDKLTVSLKPYDLLHWQKLGPHLDKMERHYKQKAQAAQRSYQSLQYQLSGTAALRQELRTLSKDYHNQAADKWMRNTSASPQLILTSQRIEVTTYPVFVWPEPFSLFDMRAHFFSPVKCFMGLVIPTPVFNIIVLFLFSLMLFGVLYLDLLRFVLKGFKRDQNL